MTRNHPSYQEWLVDRIKNDVREVTPYLNAHLEEPYDDMYEAVLVKAIADVAKAHGVNISFDDHRIVTIAKALDTIGLRLTVVPK